MPFNFDNPRDPFGMMERQQPQMPAQSMIPRNTEFDQKVQEWFKEINAFQREQDPVYQFIDKYEPEQLDPEKYKTEVPEELQRLSQEGLGPQWLMDMFQQQSEGLSEAKGQRMRELDAVMGRSGFRSSGAIERARDITDFKFGKETADILGSLNRQNTATMMSAQGRVSDIELENQRVGNILEDYNARQQLATDKLKNYWQMIEEKRSAERAAENSAFWGDLIQGGLSLAALLI